ncbi:hypothetical protein E5675_05405 [Sphingopyxis sp. PAMC25046]|uniref:hypothetical protein n=1 Tax=Sphingopyxis sp. PAMC25046 TaxID=2565556 RepID=UPI00109E2CC0|nr:hypothetical protein [Sphingopyxis sp. PAMC25046]QCB53923.1 hypothetical protein E5675_05405 [Sphingopyxis sp. PAMC25046]
MEIVISRCRLAGALPHYIYRALVPAEGIAAERCAIAGTVAAPGIAGRIACIRIAPFIAPERYLATHPVERTALASRVGAVGRRIEWLIIGAFFPEMTPQSLPIVFELDRAPGDACVWADVDDLTGVFDRVEREFASLTAIDLGLRQGDGLRAA